MVKERKHKLIEKLTNMVNSNASEGEKRNSLIALGKIFIEENEIHERTNCINIFNKLVSVNAELNRMKIKCKLLTQENSELKKKIKKID